MKSTKLILFSILLGLFIVLSLSNDIFAEYVQLIPTDDAYVAADLNNQDNPLSDLNTGNMTWQKIWYSFDSSQIGSKLTSLGYLKFDLSGINLNDISSATLNMNSFGNSIADNSVSIFKANSQNWDESSISFKTKPFFNPTPIGIIDNISTTNWVQWNVTDSITQHNSTDITFVLSISDWKKNSNEEIDLYTKESIIPNTQPFLEIEFTESKDSVDSEIPLLTSEVSDHTIIKLPVLEDAYVGVNYDDPQDLQGFQKFNSGNFNFTKIWYSYNGTGNAEVLSSTGFLKFDVSKLIPGKIIDAKLKMYNAQLDTSGADKILTLSSVTNKTWSESDLTYANQPEFVQHVTLTEVTTSNEWVAWNVTDSLKQNIDSEISWAITYSQMYPGHEEQVIFNSKESGENTPYLEIVYDEQKENGGCLIATAAYGSELAPQVQQLRELRDNSLLQTDSGRSFIESFNRIYYSFSPIIADYERENPVFKEAVKLILTPMLTSLSILNYTDMDSESSVLGYGISLILLNLGMYFVAPIMLFWKIRDHSRKINK